MTAPWYNPPFSPWLRLWMFILAPIAGIIIGLCVCLMFWGTAITNRDLLP